MVISVDLSAIRKVKYQQQFPFYFADDIQEVRELGRLADSKSLFKLRLFAQNLELAPQIRLEAIRTLSEAMNRDREKISSLDYENGLSALKLLVDSSEYKQIVLEAIKALDILGVKLSCLD